jgi:hypothetical protein
MNHFPLLPVFVASVVVVLLAIVTLFATRSWWVLGGAFAVLLAMTVVVGNEVRDTLNH